LFPFIKIVIAERALNLTFLSVVYYTDETEVISVERKSLLYSQQYGDQTRQLIYVHYFWHRPE